MGVYNPLAEMPKNCAVCHEECKYRNITAHKRHKRCPLVEVKTPHGRLVDLDALVDDYFDGFYMEISTDNIDEISVIIEAEEVE